MDDTPLPSLGPYPGVAKAPTGVEGLDQITSGGFPRGRTTLVCGAAGCGKTLLGMEFLVRGARDFDEPGVFVSFEESGHDLSENVRSLGFDLPDLIERKKVVVDHVRLEKGELEETGEYDLEGLFVRLGFAIDSINAKRVVLDTIETLFTGLSNENLLRAELVRLFRWLKDRGVTAVVTGERGEGTLTRHGLEEYVSDCVIFLDHRVDEQVSTRRLRIVKYRGSAHGTNEYPFLIDADGFVVLPLTSHGLEHQVSDERISTGIGTLDEMLGGGLYRASSVLLSGAAGTGKTSIVANIADAAARRGERAIIFAFEESPRQIVRNMGSIGLDLQRHIDAGLLRIHSVRPTFFGLEMHLVQMHRYMQEFKPSIVLVDPISNFTAVGSNTQAGEMLLRLVDTLKQQGVTGVFVNLTHAGEHDRTVSSVSSLMDTWIILRDFEQKGERLRGLFVLKSRGTDHSRRVREMRISSGGVEIGDGIEVDGLVRP
ncbi:MAG: circadian clock protein KaiC [Phycisphaerales bacterium]